MSSKIQSFNRHNCRELFKAIEGALKSVGDQFGVAFEMAGGSIDGSGATARIKLNAACSSTGEPIYVALFKSKAESLGFKHSDLNAPFDFGGKTYLLVGLINNGRSTWLLGENAAGKQYKFQSADVLRALGGSPVVDNLKDEQTREEIKKIIKELDDHPLSFGGIEQEDAIFKRLEAIDEAAGEGLAVGRIIRYQVADGYALYAVTHIGAHSVDVLHVPYADAYSSPVVRNGRLSRGHAEDAIAQEDAMRHIFSEKS